MTQEAQQAQGKVKLAIARLASRYIFHARVLEKFRLMAEPSVGTMGVSVAESSVLLLFNPEFVLATPFEQLVGVLLHEVHHIVLGHVTADPEDYPDLWALALTVELTANEFLSEPLPKGAVLLEDFPDLPARESTQVRYARLCQETDRPPIGSPGDQPAQLGSHDDGSEQDLHGDSTEQEPRSDGPGHVDALLQTIDDHSNWPGPGDLEDAKELIARLVEDATIEVGREHVPDELLEPLASLGVGHGSGAAQRDVVGDHWGKLDWRRVLRRYVGRVLTRRPTFNRPSRRFPELVGIVPGTRRQPGKPSVMAVIDTSGSITQDMLEVINAELRRLAHSCEMLVVECDDEIRAVYDYEPIENLLGGNGTDLRPPFDPSFLREHRPDLVIYFTDGFGPAPDRKPRPPVIWCLTPDGEPPASWGWVIDMDYAVEDV